MNHRAIAGIACGILMLGVLDATALAQPATQPSAMSAGVAAFNRGAFDEAIRHWQAAQIAFDRDKATARQIDARLNLAAAYQAIGDYHSAQMTLLAGVEIADAARDRSREIALRNALGSTYTFLQNYAPAEEQLNLALTGAAESHDRRAEALILNNVGNLHAARSRVESGDDPHASARANLQKAIDAYSASHRLAEQSGDRSLIAKALTNAAVSAAALLKEAAHAADGTLPHPADASNHNAAAIEAIANLSDSHEKAFFLLTAGQNDSLLIETGFAPSLRDQLMLRAHSAFSTAAAVARAIDDQRSLSYALGYLGHLYEIDGPARAEDALALTRRAVALAQQIQAADLLYQWEWQIGRLLKSQAKTPEQVEHAILAYQQAVATLQNIRNDLALGNSNRVSRETFREGPGLLYFELADMLLKRADATSNPELLQQYLVQARDAVELLKAGELLDYFQDPCVSLLEKKRRDIGAVGEGTAIVYLIPLADRTELLVSVAGGMKRFQVPIGSSQLTEEVNNLRRQLVSIRTERYIRHASQLYKWLIDPIEAELKSAGVDTLVFVPDGALRTVPMAALFDEKSEQFLIARYATAISPGLTLMEPRPIARESVQVLLNGLSEARGNFPALEYVPQELSNVQSVVGQAQGEKLIDDQFIKLNVRDRMRKEDYSIVHIASHGMFVSSSRDTFLLTYDGKLTLNELEQLLQPKQFEGRPVELLTLSACQTAVGDDRAALGLAGVAIKAGARSAVATLWCVNDQASADLITDFYRELVNNPTLSKAKAMQRAQLKLLADERYSHPIYWSPYLIIGNWL